MSWLSAAANRAGNFLKKNAGNIVKGAAVAGAVALTGGAALVPALAAAGVSAAKNTAVSEVSKAATATNVKSVQAGPPAQVATVAQQEKAAVEAAVAAAPARGDPTVAMATAGLTKRQLLVYAGVAVGVLVLAVVLVKLLRR